MRLSNYNTLKAMKRGISLNNHKAIAQKQIEEEIRKDGIVHLYHYTSIPVLFGILKKKELWWGNTATMNDRAEIQDFIQCLHHALDSSVLPGKREEFDTFFADLTSKIPENYPFAMSFSKNKDDAAQWERYADNAQGVCIEFNRAKLRELFFFQPVVPGEVGYDFDVKSHEHYSILSDYFHNGNALKGFGSLAELASNILVTASMHKHKSFSSENEYRLATLSSKMDGCFSIPCSKVEMKAIGHDIKKYLIINYEELGKKENVDFTDLFESIIIGPKSTQLPENLADFCKECGFERLSASITVSDCPLR